MDESVLKEDIIVLRMLGASSVQRYWSDQPDVKVMWT